MYPELTRYIQLALERVDEIQEDRKELLLSISEYVKNISVAKLNFICTHNSRRSHLGQIWAQVAADHFEIEVETFSGGTEATAFNHNAVEALRRAGFVINDPGGDNPRFEVSTEENKSMICFSKTYDDDANPKKDFMAIMTCSEADAECPIVFGASARTKLFYEDPKLADGTPEEATRYDERCLQIATEMLFVFSQIK